jgi:hypothetical protein
MLDGIAAGGAINGRWSGPVEISNARLAPLAPRASAAQIALALVEVLT